MTNFGILGTIPNVEEIQRRLNDGYDGFFHYDGAKERRPHVCTFCDEYLLTAKDINYVATGVLEKNKTLFQWSSRIMDVNRWQCIQPLIRAYTFQHDGTGTVDESITVNLCLSPRGVIGRTGNRQFGFSSCLKCKQYIQKGRVPFYAIINNNYVGHAPSCLHDLTEVELAFISPVKGYGYCFKWAGGARKCLTGNMTFMRVEHRSIAEATAKLEGMGLRNHIVILLSGKMTKEQRRKANQSIRVEKVLIAVQWLCQHNVRWRHIDFRQFAQEVANYVPTVIDQSEEVVSANQNLEKEKVFCCYYPDGDVNERHGGFNNPADFKDFVDRMHSAGYNLEVKVDLAKDFVRGKDGDQLVNACLLQFPYGVGGLDEERKLPDGSFTSNTYLEQWLSHLTLVSQPVFQESMFQLVVYSISSKLRLLRRARMQLRHKRTATALSTGLDLASLRGSIRAKQAGDRHGGTFAGRSLLNAVDCTSRALPHSNEAAKTARATGESMQHAFGTPSLFLTVTPDDDNSLVMQVLSGETIDTPEDPNCLTESELSDRASKRKELRLKYPGLGALYFEMAFSLIMKEVVGWDMVGEKATEKPGCFGVCEAVAAAMEEQGRGSVHVHLSIWIKGFKDLRNQVFFGSKSEKRDAELNLPKYAETICSTELIGYGRKRELVKSVDHDCPVNLKRREKPKVVDEQQLRNLRHRMGYKASNVFAKCPDCQKTFTYEDLIAGYCQEVGKLGSHGLLNSAEEGKHLSKSLMHAVCLQFQMTKGASADACPSLAVNAAYNSHASSHVHGCFKCQKGTKKKHICGCSPDCECRYRLPDRARRCAYIRHVKDDNPWFMWNGNEKRQPIIEVLPKRHTYDLFQNVSCKAITESKLTCNTNLSIITDGPVGQYQFKYIMKSTQEDDTSAYALVEHSIKSLESRVHEDDTKEAMRLICRAAFAHNKKNVIGPALASYLTRHDSRFYFSHEFAFVPMHDLKRALNQETLAGNVQYSGETDNAFLENAALHYLCRPDALEHLSPRDFFENYNVVTIRKVPKNGELDLRFKPDTGYFQHPSATKARGNKPSFCRQGVALRSRPSHIKITQWIFPDTATFKNNILTCLLQHVNPSMEKYSANVLLLFHSYRSLRDFSVTSSNHGTKIPYTLKLREINDIEHQLPDRSKRVFNFKNLCFLQNIQNCAYNSLRYKLSKDDLQSETECFKPKEVDQIDTNEIIVDENTSDDEEEDFAYELFLQSCMAATDMNDDDPSWLKEKLQEFSFQHIRNRGVDECGRSSNVPLVDVEETVYVQSATWIRVQSITNQSRSARNAQILDKKEVLLADVVKLLLRQKETKVRAKVFENNPTAEVLEATGTFESIQDWARAAGLDDKQKRAFEAIIASFLLTFHDFQQDDYNDATLDGNARSEAHNAKSMLIWLKGGNGTQLIILVHGPGGSGKSTVIALVISYAEEYCSLLGHPFTIRTIVVTGLSGVSATLIHGETTHMSMGLNRTSVTEEMIEAWADTRLVIIDECSFASADIFNKIQKNAQDLKQDTFRYFGGLNVVFAGDFSQLEPPGKAAIYDGEECPAFHGLLNGFIELDGQHRFKDDPVYGEIMMRFRQGTPTIEDIRLLNANCLISDSHIPPPNVQVAVYRNRNRDAINTAIFEQFCHENKPLNPSEVFNSALLVFMDDLHMKDSTKTYVRVMSNEVKDYFYRNCGEDACQTSDITSGRVDPVLKLYPGCPMMLTENKDVPNGQANGSRMSLISVNVRPEEQPIILELFCGTKIRSYFASQISSMTMRHQVNDIDPEEFEVVPKSYTFQAKISIDGEMRHVLMKGVQLPIISNSVTTGHKLQGSSLTALLVAEHHYGQNWMYVVLSRVRTMNGLYLTQPLTEDLSKYAMSEDMKNMIANFQERVGLNLYSDDDYRFYS